MSISKRCASSASTRDACLAFEDSANGIRSAEAAGLAVIATPTWYSLAESLPPAFVSLPHLGDPDHPLPKGAPGAPCVDLARLREWHRHAHRTRAFGEGRMLLTDKTTFTEFLIEARRSHPEARGDLNGVLHSVATACKAISRAVAHGIARRSSRQCRSKQRARRAAEEARRDRQRDLHPLEREPRLRRGHGV